MLSDTERTKLREALQLERLRLLRNAQDGLAFSMNRDRTAIGRDSIDESMEEEIFCSSWSTTIFITFRCSRKWKMLRYTIFRKRSPTFCSFWNCLPSNSGTSSASTMTRRSLNKNVPVEATLNKKLSAAQ